MAMLKEAASIVGHTRACEQLGVPRSTYYRRALPRMLGLMPARPRPARALKDDDRKAVLEVLHSERFVDKAPATVVATLQDEGVYLCSTRTAYRLLAAAGEVRERRRQARHVAYKKPELLATGPNQVWSWDITKLKGPVKWTYYYLYSMIDIFSRCTVGWIIADWENASLAQVLIDESCAKHGIRSGQLVIHSDRGSPMIAKGTAQLMADLGVTKSHSRPYVSDDNPFSEAQFKTLKYRPDFPATFGALEDAKSFCRRFFEWYNGEHCHSGIAYLTPDDVHNGRATEVLANRQAVLDMAFEAHPERFVARAPTTGTLPEATWISPPARQAALVAAVQ